MDKLAIIDFFFFNDTATTEIYTLSLHDALPIYTAKAAPSSAPEPRRLAPPTRPGATRRSGNGSRPTNASPKTTTTKPATACTRVEFSETALPTRPAPAPSATKSTVKPATNGRLARKTP